jgi:endoglucanase
VDGCCPTSCGSSGTNALCNATLVTPPLNQPIQKSYRDWNTNWPQDSWTVTECGIYTQASYVRLLSWFLDASCVTTSTQEPSIENNFPVVVFPNPVHDELTVTGISTRVKITGELYTLVGEKIRSMEFTSEKTSMSLEDISSGVYFLQMKSESGIVVKKIVKE